MVNQSKNQRYFQHIKRYMLRISINSGHFKFWNQQVKTEFPIPGLTGGKYFIKTIFDITIEIGIFERSNVPNFHKFRVLLMLGPIWAKQAVNI